MQVGELFFPSTLNRALDKVVAYFEPQNVPLWVRLGQIEEIVPGRSRSQVQWRLPSVEEFLIQRSFRRSHAEGVTVNTVASLADVWHVLREGFPIEFPARVRSWGGSLRLTPDWQ